MPGPESSPALPWTDEQVAALNDYQNSGQFHPFTCGGNRSDTAHVAACQRFGLSDNGALVATRVGWICPACDYRQEWAHDVMFARLSPAPEGVDAREVKPPTDDLAGAALAAWNALPDDERNGERPFVMGFNAGWEEALSQQDEGADSDCAICGQPPHKHSGGFPNTCPMIATYRPSRPPAEQVRMREALEEAAGVLRELIEPDMSVKATSIYLRAKAAESKARAALTPPPKGQNDHG